MIFTSTADAFLSSREIRDFFQQLKQEPNNITKQDENTIIWLEFNGSVDEFRISLSSSSLSSVK